MMRKAVLILISIFILPILTNAAVTVVKRAIDVNPKMYFGGIRGNANVDRFMKSNLRNCGWFDLVNSPKDARYAVDGYVSGEKVIVNVKNNESGESFQVGMGNSINSKQSSYKIMDTILNKLFGIPGICNSKIAFDVQLGKNKEIYICNFDGTDVKGITGNKTLSLEPSWGLNNSLIVYTKYRNTYTDIVGKSLTNGKTYRLATFPGLNSAASVSPNGKYIALILSKDRQVELYIKELKGRGVKRITNDSAVEGSPCWSPNGRYICYVSDSRGRPDLYIYDVRTGSNRKISTVGSEAVSPDWSSAANKIVYSARFGKQYTLALYDVAKGTSQVVDINSAGNWMSPSWAPDGRHVVCSRTLNYNSQLYIVDTWTGKARKLLNYNYNLTSPSWSGLL